VRKYFFTISNRLPIAVTSIVSLLLSATAAAAAPPRSTDMAWSTPTATPRGYAEYCARYQGQCLATPAEQTRYAAIAAISAPQTAANFWGASFAAQDETELADANTDTDTQTETIQTAAAAPSGNFWNVAFKIEPASLVQPVGAAKDQVDWASGFAALDAKRSPEAVIDTTPSVSNEAETPRLEGPTPVRVALDKKTWALISKTNLAINSAIARADDLDNDGVPDRWDLPLLDGNRNGDCEDYALEKRRQLVQKGLPAEALSLAIVRTSWGEVHAVLVVDTDRGAYVLDSLTPWVTPWNKTNFHWITRQAAGGGLWVRPGPPTFQMAALER